MDGYSLVSSGCSLREKRCSTYRSLLRTVLLLRTRILGVGSLWSPPVACMRRHATGAEADARANGVVAAAYIKSQENDS